MAFYHALPFPLTPCWSRGNMPSNAVVAHRGRCSAASLLYGDPRVTFLDKRKLSIYAQFLETFFQQKRPIGDMTSSDFGYINFLLSQNLPAAMLYCQTVL